MEGIKTRLRAREGSW